MPKRDTTTEWDVVLSKSVGSRNLDFLASYCTQFLALSSRKVLVGDANAASVAAILLQKILVIQSSGLIKLYNESA